jgi:hypothetical protein
VNRLHINETVVKRGETNCSDQQDTPRFLKPPMAIDDWQIVNGRKSKSSRPVKHCFKCFLPGHFKTQCKNSIKCFRCGKSGHTQYKWEETKKDAPKRFNNELKQKELKQQEQIIKNYSKMANNLLYAERPYITTVYFERRDHLNQHTQFFHQSRLITFRNSASLLERIGQVAAALTCWIGWHPKDYEVYESDIASFITLFPGPLNRNHAVRCSPYKLHSPL